MARTMWSIGRSSLCILAFSALVILPSVLSHDCIQDRLQAMHKPEKIDVPYTSHGLSGNDRKFKVMQTIANLRIVLDTDRLLAGGDPGRSCESAGQAYPNTGAGDSGTCQTGDVLSSAQRTFLLNTLLPKAQTMLQDALQVEPISSTLRFSGSCVGIDTIPDKYASTGVAGDFVIFVTARPTQTGTLAWAAFCKTDGKGRPVVAHINIGPGGIDPNLEAKQVMVAVHELTHGLGFASNAFSSYLDENGSPRSQVTDKAIVNGKTVTRIVTPSALFQARQHFGCNTLAGVEVEDVGGAGSAGSHWEKRIFDNEFMTATASSEMVVSAVTLGLLEDTGWYYPLYQKAQKFLWGNGAGCTFVQAKCSAWDSKFFCSSSGEIGCTLDLTARATCSLAKYNGALPSEYQYFEDPTVGGSDQFADYCPKLSPFSDGDCRILANAHSQTVAFGETFGSSARCFKTTLLSTDFQPNPTQRVGCFPLRCDSSGNIEAQIGGSQWVACPAGQKITVSGYSGELECPPDTTACVTGTVTATPPPPPPPSATPTPGGTTTATPTSTATPTPTPVTSAQLPSAPGTPTCTEGNVLVLRWTAPSSAGDAPVTQYTLRHDGGSASGGFRFTAFSGDALQANVANVAKDIGIRFTVSASNSKGEGPQSAPSSQCTLRSDAVNNGGGGTTTDGDEETGPLGFSEQWWFYAALIAAAIVLAVGIYLLCCRKKGAGRQHGAPGQPQPAFHQPMQQQYPPQQQHYPQPGYPPQQPPHQGYR